MLETIIALSQSKSEYAFEIAESLYQRLESISSTTISLQYEVNNFLTFKVYEASEGIILRQGLEFMGVQCLIRGITYRLTHEHLDQLSNRELRELLNHLGIQDSHFQLN
ncbi:hypothetical protein [Allocoleopsis sp.]|uniref:hypothetical protein n=1 Tax=Allocoleopsis sp. TaxID=3088169 RepID=UPI002FD734AF